MNQADNTESHIEEWGAEDIVRNLDKSEDERFFLPIPTSENEEQDFCVLILNAKESDGFTEKSYHIAFLNTPDSSTATTPSYKTWKELETETRVNFRAMIAPAPSTVRADSDSAILNIQNRVSLVDIINLCEDIADSISIGGHEPLEARGLFKAYFKPMITDVHAPKTRPLVLN